MSPARFRRVALAALVALCAIVLTGAAVRLTGAGLGCTDWPGCEQERFVPAADLHPWIEFGNRLVTGVVSVAVIAAVLSSRRRRPHRADLERWSWGLVAGVVAQVVIGALTVRLHLPPGVVAVHFLVSMVLVWSATELWLRAGREGQPSTGAATVEGRTRLLTLAVLAWTPVVLVAGTVVTAAGPHRGDEDVEPLAVSLGAVARLHGLSAMVMVALTVAAMVAATRSVAAVELRRSLETVMAVLVIQGVVGYVQYFTGVPAGLVAVHVLGATLLVVAVTHLRHTLATAGDAPPGREAARPDAAVLR